MAMDILNTIRNTLFDFLQFSLDYFFIIFIVLFCFLSVLYKNEIITFFQRLFSKQYTRKKQHQKYSSNQSDYDNEYMLNNLNKRIDEIEKRFNQYDLQIENKNSELSTNLYYYIEDKLKEFNQYLNTIREEQKTIRSSVTQLEKELNSKISGKMDAVEIESKFKQVMEDLSLQLNSLEERIMVNERLLNLNAKNSLNAQIQDLKPYLKKGEEIIQSNPALSECAEMLRKLSVFYEMHRSIPSQKDIYLNDIKSEIYNALNLKDSRNVFIFNIAKIVIEHTNLKNELENIRHLERNIKNDIMDKQYRLDVAERTNQFQNNIMNYKKLINDIEKKRKQHEPLQKETIAELLNTSRTSLLERLRERLPKLREENTQPDILELIDKHLRDAGIERIQIQAGVTSLNDRLHIAVEYAESTGLESKTIVSVIRDGFIVDDEIWERAEVITARS